MAPLVAAGSAIARTVRPARRGPLGDDSPADGIALDLGGDDEAGGSFVREPRRPRPNAPLAASEALPLPLPDEPAEAVAQPPDD